jgi:hypothetical protein
MEFGDGWMVWLGVDEMKRWSTTVQLEYPFLLKAIGWDDEIQITTTKFHSSPKT